MSAPAPTRIELCGQLSVTLGGKAVEGALPGRQGRLLFAYLVLNRDRPTSRDRLIDLLWPRRAPADPDESLSALLSKLRRVVGPQTIRGRTDLTLVLAPDAWIDLEVARAAAERAESELARANHGEAWTSAHAALEVANRGFFAHYDNPWAQERGEEVEQLRLRCLECIAAAGVAIGGSEAVAAERAAREAIALAPLREPAYRLLMDALAARDDVAGALTVYEQLRARLSDELGIAPGPAARALHQRLVSGSDQIEKFATREPERKVVTVVLGDVVPDVDPERSEAWLEQLRAVAADEVEARGGALQTATGGGVLVTFGVPAAQEDHARRGVELGRALADRFRGSAPVRIAIETGEVVVGRTGLTGPPVQAATRMLHEADAGAVLIGGRTASAARPRASASPFVGRQGEIDALMSLARDLNSPRLVTIIGDAGVGKSRLVRELQARLAAEMPRVRQLLGRCLSYGRGLTYRALADVLSAIRAHSDDPPAAWRILDLTLGHDVAGDLHPLAALEQLRLAWVELIGRLGREGPVLLVIEDLHWAQPDLLDLLEQLVSEVAGPLLLVGTARPEVLDARPSWGRRREATTVWLEPLEPRDAARLVEDAPAGVRDVVLERAEGNPFFLEELVACFGEAGDLDAAAIPDSIRGVLAARIDQLPPLEKEALQAASVIGRTFWREAVEALLAGAPASFSLLEERDFVRPRPSSSLAGVRELAFKHALTREVAYGTLARARRARFHGEFARWLEAQRETADTGPDEDAALLAHHYYEAYEASAAGSPELRERALHWLRRSGELATARYEIDEALALLSRALELEPDDAGRCATYRAIARANALKFDGEAFWSAMEKAADVAPDGGIRADIISRLAVESFVRAGMWTRTPAIEQIGEWVARALELAEPGTASRARALTAKASLDLDDRAAAAEAAAIAERLGDPELCVHAWDACGAAAMVAGDYESAWRWRTRRLELLDRVTDPDLRTIIGETPYASCIATARFAQAREIAQLHDELTRPLTPHHRMHGAAILVEVEELLGGWEDIRARETRVIEAVTANAATPCLRNARSLLVCALAAACLGDDRRATELERAAAELGLLGRQVLDAPRLRLALLRGDREGAERLLAGLLDESGWYARGHGTSLATLTTRLDALAMLGQPEGVEREAPRLLQPGTYVEPFALRALGISRREPTLIEQAIDRFDRLDLAWHARQTRALL